MSDTRATGEGWAVTSACINCGAARAVAPGLIVERGGKSTFARQPGNRDEIAEAWRAQRLCPVVAVRSPPDLREPAQVFPFEIEPGVFMLGYNARSSFGANSYLVSRDAGNVMIDGSRWTRRLTGWLEANGGLSTILLTHRDDVGDAARYAGHFGARVFIHRDDAAGADFATDFFDGTSPSAAAPGITAIPVPGHTRGSVVFLTSAGILFTGDSLAWDHQHGRLTAFRQACWYDWSTQLTSLGALEAYRFRRILPGHGGLVALDPDAMAAALHRMLVRLRSDA